MPTAAPVTVTDEQFIAMLPADYDQLAKALKVTAGTVKQRVARMRRAGHRIVAVGKVGDGWKLELLTGEIVKVDNPSAWWRY